MRSSIQNIYTKCRASVGIEDPESLKPGESRGNLLETLDNATLSWYHIKAVLVGGLGFFTVSYSLFNVGLVTKLIGYIYYEGSMPLGASSAISSVALCGTLAGQIFFGFAADRFGRKPVYFFCLSIMVLASLCSGISFGRSPQAVVASLCFWRFFLGFGAGGDYPITATFVAEYSNKSHRGAFVAALFAMQGLGILAGTAVVIIFSKAFKNIAENPENADYLWRYVLMLGAIPSGLTLYARFRFPETPRYTLCVLHDIATVEADMVKVTGIKHTPASYATIKQKKFVWTRPAIIKLLGCGAAWFLLDIAFYSQNLFQADVYTNIGWVPNIKVFWPQLSPDFLVGDFSKTCSSAGVQSGAFPFAVAGKASCPTNKYMCTNDKKNCWMTPLDQAYLGARAQAIIALGSVIPGYWFTVFTIEKMGRWNIQMMGFFFMTTFMAFLAGFYDYFLRHIEGYVIMYAFTFFFANWGPNATTFIIPAEIFPTSVRASAHGMCAAMGKMGAIVGAFGFQYASQDPTSAGTLATYGKPVGVGILKTLGILAAVNFLGMVVTILFVPDVPLDSSLEEVTDEM